MRDPLSWAGFVLSVCAVGTRLQAQNAKPLGFDPRLTFAGNFDAGYRKTQFVTDRHDAMLGQWDTRIELWLPPYRDKFALGPYMRLTGIAASKAEAWENVWLGRPGVGFQMYPFSALRGSRNTIVQALGPTRLFAEYNWLKYWGAENVWRPRKQTRFGAEHWRSLHVNDVKSAWWAETWNGLWRQSANEFSATYKTWIFANAVRAGLRAPTRKTAALAPYVALESSLTDNQAYFWENRLLAGGGIRFAPSLIGVIQDKSRLNRFAIYAEYLHVAKYYRLLAPPTIPNHEVRLGVTFSTGVWYQ